MTLTMKAPGAVLSNPPVGTGCARCAEYERRIEVLEKQLAAWEEWEESALLYDTHNKIRPTGVGLEAVETVLGQRAVSAVLRWPSWRVCGRQNAPDIVEGCGSVVVRGSGGVIGGAATALSVDTTSRWSVRYKGLAVGCGRWSSGSFLRSYDGVCDLPASRDAG